jgi:hypothetical protein
MWAQPLPEMALTWPSLNSLSVAGAVNYLSSSTLLLTIIGLSLFTMVSSFTLNPP